MTLLYSSTRDQFQTGRPRALPTTAQTQVALIHQQEKQIQRMAEQIAAKDQRIEQLTVDLRNEQLAVKWLQDGTIKKGFHVVLNGRRIEPSDKIEVSEWQPMPLEVNGQ